MRQALIMLAIAVMAGCSGTPARPMCATGDDLHRVVVEYYGTYTDEDLDHARRRCGGQLGIWTDTVTMRDAVGTCDIPDRGVPGNGRRIHHLIPPDVRREKDVAEIRSQCEYVDRHHHDLRGADNRWLVPSAADSAADTSSR